MQSIALYIHIPFCRRRCPYCDFVVHIDPKAKIDTYLGLCLEELQLQKNSFQKDCKLRSIYFGGGTPSLAPARALATFIQAAQNLFTYQDSLEITLECNPEDNDLDFGTLANSGINRLSLGTQSANDAKLLLLGRVHRKKDIEIFLERARKNNFKNISLDLIFGTPGEDLQTLEKDLESFLSLSPDHISTYELTIERGTNFFEQVKEKKLILPPDILVEEQMLFLDRQLTGQGFEHYEISNFAKPGCTSIHNAAYWDQQEYLGLGVGAHSFLDGIRRANVTSLRDYQNAITDKKLATAFSEELTAQQKSHEILMLGFRTQAGIAFEKWRAVTNKDFLEQFSGLIPYLLEKNLCVATKEKIIPTISGMMVADSIAAACMREIPGIP